MALQDHFNIIDFGYLSDMILYLGLLPFKMISRLLKKVTLAPLYLYAHFSVQAEK